jgi:hypothetical protein
MTDLLVMAISEPGGGVTLRICRRKTENPAADAAPLELTHGVLDIPLDHFAMAEIFSACSEGLWHRVREIK